MSKILTIASDCTHWHEIVLPDTTSDNVVDLANSYGRAESGEVIQLIIDGDLIARAGWDSQYRKYRKQLDDGRWL